MGGPAQLTVQEAGVERAGLFNALALVRVCLALPSTLRPSFSGAVNLCNKELVALLSSMLSVRDLLSADSCEQHPTLFSLSVVFFNSIMSRGCKQF